MVIACIPIAIFGIFMPETIHLRQSKTNEGNIALEDQKVHSDDNYAKMT